MKFFSSGFTQYNTHLCDIPIQCIKGNLALTVFPIYYLDRNFIASRVISQKTFDIGSFNKSFRFEIRAAQPTRPNLSSHVYIIPQESISDFTKRISIFLVKNNNVSQDLIGSPLKFENEQANFEHLKLEEFNNYGIEISNETIEWRINEQIYFNKSSKTYFEGINNLQLKFNLVIELIYNGNWTKEGYNEIGSIPLIKYLGKNCSTLLIDYISYEENSENVTENEQDQKDQNNSLPTTICGEIRNEIQLDKVNHTIKTNLKLLWQDEFNGWKLNKTNWIIRGDNKTCESKFIF